MNETVFFTVTNYFYLNKALALKKSFNEFNPNIKFIIYLFEERDFIPSTNFEDEYLLVSELNIPNYYNLAFKYDVVEFTTSLKPYLTLNLLDSYTNVVFLDPDTFVYKDFNYLLELLNKRDIILSPHYISPILNEKDSDLGMMKYGSFNLGFYAVRKSSNSLGFLNWWHDKCINQCYFESHNGLSTDQKWVSIANVFFDVYNLKHPGFNLSYWNIHERNVTRNNNEILVNGLPLFFIHYSSFIEDSKTEYLSSRASIQYKDISDNETLKLLFNNYRKEIQNFKSTLNLKSYTYSYDKFYGMYISLLLRRIYGFNSTNFETNPFNDKILFHFAKRKRLISKNPPAKNKSEKNLGAFRKFIIKIFLKTVVYLFSGRKINNLLRMFIYLASPQRIDNLYEFKVLNKNKNN
tara:strand:+ start:12054 stop:13274 length:1221 start_codon:yes stop_codon:yes gene_type:complete